MFFRIFLLLLVWISETSKLFGGIFYLLMNHTFFYLPVRNLMWLEVFKQGEWIIVHFNQVLTPAILWIQMCGGFFFSSFSIFLFFSFLGWAEQYIPCYVVCCFCFFFLPIIKDHQRQFAFSCWYYQYAQDYINLPNLFHILAKGNWSPLSSISYHTGMFHWWYHTDLTRWTRNRNYSNNCVPHMWKYIPSKFCDQKKSHWWIF